MNEMDTHIAVITESWFKDGQELENLKEELHEGSGVGMLCKNRTPNQNGVAYGGVSLLWKDNNIKFREVPLKNPADYEILAAAGSVPGQRRKIVVLGCYIPPNYSRIRGDETLHYITDTLIDLKRQFHDPQFIITGDFNQWNILLI